MYRRHFFEMASGALAGSALAGYASRIARDYWRQSANGAQAPMNATAFHAERRYAKTRFGKIAYVERGTGEAALFLHALFLNGFQWRGALERLSAHRRCVAPDFMAMGYTEAADGQSVAPDAQVAMLITLLDTLSISTVDLIANDTGGAVAQLFVTQHPKRVRTLLLTNCDTEPDCPPTSLFPFIKMAQAGTLVDQAIVPLLTNKALARSAESMGGAFYVDPGQPTDEAIECYFAPLASSPKRKAQVNAAIVALERNVLAGVEPSLKRCRLPTRIVWGTGDKVFSPASPDYLDRVLGASRGVRRIEGRKLFWPEEMPDVIADEARRLWGIS